MPDKPLNYLLIRLSLVLVAILTLAFFSMSNALYTAQRIQGQAAAINESGKLRMRSYRIANNLLPDYWDSLEHWQKTTRSIREFEARLSSPRLVNAIPEDINSPQRIAYTTIKQRWFNDIRPLFDLYLEGIVPPSMSITEGAIIDIRNRYLQSIDGFVNKIDELVTLLERDMEVKIQHLHRYQFMTLILVLILVIIALLMIWRYLILPLKHLLIAAEKTARADFSFRTPYTGQDELGRLGQAFNSMSDDLSTLYGNLEKHVQEKTQGLERSNQSLELLYETAKLLNSANSPQDQFHQVLKKLQQVTGLGQGAICLNSDKQQDSAIIASTLASTDSDHHLCELSNCKNCFRTEATNPSISISTCDQKPVVSIPIKSHQEQYGVLILETGENKPLQPWQMQLLESVAQQMGAAINKSRIEAELNKMALVDERNIIARELHDSLAQSLTFMKIQVSRLSAHIQAEHSTQDVPLESMHILDELRSGLNCAYQELRELLNTFRLKPETRAFHLSLEDTIHDLSKKGDIHITIDNQLSFCDFTANEEIHLLQIIREAVSNVIQHAQASQVIIHLGYQQKQIRVQIDDDGIGIPAQPERANHYGLISMRERSRELGGTLEFTHKPSGGTRVELLFKPTRKMIPIS